MTIFLKTGIIIDMFDTLPSCWQAVLREELKKKYIKDLTDFLATERQRSTVYPKEKDVLRCFVETPYNKVKLVILGQDPYHGVNQAEGLCFSVPESMPAPPSLKNILKELENDLNIKKKSHSLLAWARQGVLLLNTLLTVKQGSPLSHAEKGWERFTDAVMTKLLAEKERPCVYMLWGKQAEDKLKNICSEKSKNTLILRAPHPSPLSAYRGFFGCHHFTQANAFLVKNNFSAIDFSL